MNPLLHSTVIRRQAFKRAEGLFEATFAFSRAPLPDLAARRLEFLSAPEEEYFQTLQIEARQRSFLIGRYCVKEALAGRLGSSNRTAWDVGRGVFQQPVLGGPGTDHLQASLSHSGMAGTAVVYAEGHPLGTDLEQIIPERSTVIQSQMTEAEKTAAASLAGNRDENLSLVWSAKEALSKVLRTGLMTPFKVFELEGLAWEGGALLGTFKNFAQYRAIAFPLGDLAFALVLPKRSELDCTTAEFRRALEYPSS